MYPKYFGLKEPSFSIAPDPHYLFLSEQHKEALAHLLYGAGESGGFVLLTGEVGTGKTTVCRAFLEQLPEGVEVALILNPAVTVNELLQTICDELRIELPPGESSVKQLVDRLNAYLLDAHAKGRRPVLIIDEAQNLRPRVLEQIRLLTNLETTKHKLLQIFLIGQPELRRMLERDALRQINQRVTARFHLRPFDLKETGEYIRHRIAVAGVDRPLFTAAAIREIHRSSGGVPRLVNILCDRALLGACVTRGTQVTPAIVKRAAREVKGESIERPARPVVRPSIAAAAAFMLAMIAGWLVYQGVTPETTGSLADLWSAPETVASGPSDPDPTTPEPGTTETSLLAPLPEEGDAPTDAPTTPQTAATESESNAQVDPLPLIEMARFAPEVVDETLARIGTSESEAMRRLLLRWGVEVEGLPANDPCAGVIGFGLRCARERGTLANLRFFDRPAILAVQGVNGARHSLVLTSLGTELGTLDLSTGPELIPVDAIESIWTGDSLLLWQTPPGGEPLIGPGSAGEPVRWLRGLLAEVPEVGLVARESAFFDPELGRAVRAFQTASGLAEDGIAGPRTLIQLQNAVDLPGLPRLMPRSGSPEIPAAEVARP